MVDQPETVEEEPTPDAQDNAAIVDDDDNPETINIRNEPDVGTFRFVAGPANQAAPYLAPDLPPYFVPRTEFYALKRQILEHAGGLPYPLTLHGPSGAGKTALATALAHDADLLRSFPDGVLWISLTENEDPQQAQREWGDALGNELSGLAETAARATALRHLLNEKRCLLIIDDVSDVEQVKALNVGGPYCVRIITTDDLSSLNALKTRRYAVSKMREEEALKLLAEWAGLLPDIYLPTIKEIIIRLCHLPLAIALVGGQARQGITWLRLLEVLRDDQGPIATLKIDDPEVRVNALGLIINVVLSRFGGVRMKRAALLGAFAAGTGAPFSVEASASGWDLELTETRETLELLADGAAVQRIPGGYYALHRAMRDHLRRMTQPADLLEAAKRIRSYYLKLLEEAMIDTDPLDQQLGQIMFAYRQSSEQEEKTESTIFSDSLMAYFERRGLWASFATLSAAAVERTREAGDVMQEHLYLADVGYAQTMLGDINAAQETFKRSLEISQQLGDPSGESNALNNLGAIAERQNRYADAENYYRSSLSIRERMGVREDIASSMNNLAGVLFWQGRHEEALSVFQRVLDMYNVLDNRSGQAQTQLNIGAAYESLGNDVEALQAYQRSLAVYSNLKDTAGEANALNNIGIVHLNRGETERALDHFKRSLALKERLNDESGQASSLNNIAMLYERTGSPVLALEHYERAYKLLRSIDDPRAAVVEENIRLLKELVDGEKNEE